MTDAPANWSFPLGVFDAFGIELEYMIVDRETLDVRPICDELFREATGSDASDFEPEGPEPRAFGPCASNAPRLHA